MRTSVRIRSAAWMALAALVAIATPAVAQQQCYDACQSWSECDMQCYDGGQLSTCGEWGTCNPHCCAAECHPSTISCDYACRDCGGTGEWTTCGGVQIACGECDPHYVLYDSTVIGAYAVEIFSPDSCDYHIVERREYRDDECGGDPQISCVDYVYYSDAPSSACCASNWCGGQMCS